MKKHPLLEPFTTLSARDATEYAEIEKEARTLAVQRQPPAHQTSLSKAEAAAVELIENRIDARAKKNADSAGEILSRLVELPDPRADRNMTQLPEHVANCIMAVFHDLAPAIRQTVAAERDGKAKYNAFRDANGLLERDPDYPPSRILHFAVILLAMLGESAVNGVLYFNATPNGYLGGLTMALLIAAINIGLAVVAGVFPLRHLNLPNPRVRYWAVPMLVVIAVTVVFINLYAAHYRDLAASADDFDEARVLARLVSEPFNLSLNSFGLFVLGLLAAGFACFKGCTASDPYPGYEQQHRRYIGAVEDLDYLKSSIHGGIETVREAEIVYAADKPMATLTLIEAMRKSHAALVIQQDRTRALDVSDIKAATASIKRFRELNLAIRTDGIAPDYFAIPPDFSHLADPTETALARSSSTSIWREESGASCVCSRRRRAMFAGSHGSPRWTAISAVMRSS